MFKFWVVNRYVPNSDFHSHVAFLYFCLGFVHIQLFGIVTYYPTVLSVLISIPYISD